MFPEKKELNLDGLKSLLSFKWIKKCLSTPGDIDKLFFVATSKNKNQFLM